MRRTDKEYRRRLIEEVELYARILNKTVSLLRAINAYESDLKAVAEKETVLNKYPEIVTVNVKELTFDIRIQLGKSLDFLDRISKTGKYLG